MSLFRTGPTWAYSLASFLIGIGAGSVFVWVISLAYSALRRRPRPRTIVFRVGDRLNIEGQICTVVAVTPGHVWLDRSPLAISRGKAP